MNTFECVKCGNCCREPGYVRLLDTEPDAMARHLGLGVFDFIRAYTRLTSDRQALSLAEKPDGSCVFLKESGECAVQAAKPQQCRDFPTKWHFAGYERI